MSPDCELIVQVDMMVGGPRDNPYARKTARDCCVDIFEAQGLSEGCPYSEQTGKAVMARIS